MAKLIGELFWERVDEVKGDVSLRSICMNNGIPYETIKGAKSQKRLLRIQTAQKLAEALGTTNDYLMGGRNNIESSPADEKDETDEKLQELVALCKENPKLLDTLLSVAHLTLGK